MEKLSFDMKVSTLKNALRSVPETAKMIKPSTKNEIFLDWDENGTVDFAFISSKSDGNIDTFAIDLTGDGECDMYFYDTDGNGVCDEIRYYPDGADTPVYTYKGKDVEELIEKEALNLLDLLNADFDAVSFIAELREIKEHILFSFTAIFMYHLFFSFERCNPFKIFIALFS